MLFTFFWFWMPFMMLSPVLPPRSKDGRPARREDSGDEK
jgi:hypothetical protein